MGAKFNPLHRTFKDIALSIYVMCTGILT
jgi:hypothetical protein